MHCQFLFAKQRLNYYKENWYLDAWDHLRNELRSFALDALCDERLTDKPIKLVSDKVLSTPFDAGYGIFSGANLEWAELAFTSERAKWVSKEQWHPEQESWTTVDGIYHLKVPYSDPRELYTEIMRYAPEVKVISPKSLPDQIKKQLTAALENI